MKAADQSTRLADLRGKTDYTLRDIEEMLRKAGVEKGISYSRLAKFEKDPTIRIKRSVLAELARIFKTSVDFILYGADGPALETAAPALTGQVRGKTSTRAERLASLRQRVEMSGASVAEAATQLAGRPVTHFNIDKYERDSSATINPAVLGALAKIYKTTEGYITNGVDSVDAPLPNRQTTEQILTAMGDEAYVDLPFVPFHAYGSFVSGCRERKFMDLSTYRVLKRPGIDYKDAVVIEVTGNSMAPRYPDRSCHAVRPVSDGNWQYATGVHAISLRNEMFIIKRISSNREGILTLTSDNNAQEMTIQLGDILCMWKVGESVYTPAED